MVVRGEGVVGVVLVVVVGRGGGHALTLQIHVVVEVVGRLLLVAAEWGQQILLQPTHIIFLQVKGTVSRGFLVQ